MTNHVVEVALIKYLISNIPNYTIKLDCMAYIHDYITNFNFIDNITIVQVAVKSLRSLVFEAAAVIYS